MVEPTAMCQLQAALPMHATIAQAAMKDYDQSIAKASYWAK
jgi:hypothetical protein